MSDVDLLHMRRALELAARAHGRTRPNPCVGAVIVAANGEVLGEGFHRRAGMPHAEVEAITAARAAGRDVRGATIYVTLEPCNHTGRTGPCTVALLEAGIARVVIAQRDPNAVSGGGMERLRAEGLRIDTGLCEQEALLLNGPFNTFHRLKRPLITLKWAMTLDGCTSLPNGESKWITGEAARAEVHRRRAASDAVLAGIGTVLRDDARLSARLDDPDAPPPPLRIVLDSMLRLPADSAFVRDGSPAMVACCEAADESRERALRERGIEILRLKRGPHGISIPDLIFCLYSRGIQSVSIEGGRTAAGCFLEHRLVDRIEAWIAPKIAGGGAEHLGPIRLPNPLESINDALALQHTQITRHGDDLLVEGWLDDRQLK